MYSRCLQSPKAAEDYPEWRTNRSPDLHLLHGLKKLHRGPYEHDGKGETIHPGTEGLMASGGAGTFYKTVITIAIESVHVSKLILSTLYYLVTRPVLFSLESILLVQDPSRHEISPPGTAIPVSA
jgi:hypothetical protein